MVLVALAFEDAGLDQSLEPSGEHRA